MDNDDNRRVIKDAGGLKVTKIDCRFFAFYLGRFEISNGCMNWLWKVMAVPVTTWHMPCAQYDGIYELPEESHYFSYLPVEFAD